MRGIIVDIENRNDTVKNVLLECVEKEDTQKYIERLKSIGYTIEKDDLFEIGWEANKSVYVYMEKAE